ncbi:MAG: pyruvate dehydrogenase (acetyl-transferring) E1 component subunit alpha [Gammaproteobacteria bacterium]
MTTIATFQVNYTQYLDAQGSPTQALPEFTHDTEILIALYRNMVLTRAYDTKAIALQRTGKMGTYASTLGQEAIGTALGRAMRREDVLCPFYRDYAAQIQRGINFSEIYQYWGGDERGSQFANNAHDLPISVPIASQCLHAAGVATAFKLRGESRVAVATVGDGGTSQGDFYEAMNVAGAWNLPVVFIVNNNQWAISVPLAQQTKAQTIAQKAIAAGFEGEQVDGNDVIACFDVIKNALEHTRAGGGPRLVEALTYRLCDHTTADDAKRYRADEELERAQQREPILRLRLYLQAQNLWNDSEEQKLQAWCQHQVQTAVDTYLNQTPQTPTSMFDYLYAQLPTAYDEQYQQVQEI